MTAKQPWLIGSSPGPAVRWFRGRPRGSNRSYLHRLALRLGVLVATAADFDGIRAPSRPRPRATNNEQLQFRGMWAKFAWSAIVNRNTGKATTTIADRVGAYVTLGNASLSRRRAIERWPRPTGVLSSRRSRYRLRYRYREALTASSPAQP